VDERIRISDADRDRVTARLREHFAEGRLSSEELDERISAALSAKTVGDLRRVMADLPEPAPAAPQGWPSGRPAVRYRAVARRRPRLLPVMLLALIAALVIPGAGWVLSAFFSVILAFWLVAFLAVIVAAARFRRHVRRHWQSGEGPYWHHYQWHS
jgi:Domain of unknown function (DUF1707)